MTDDEKKQVQNLLNSRTKLQSEKIALQEQQIASLNTELEGTKQELEASRIELAEREQEISGLRTQLEEAQDQARKLTALIQARKPEPEAPAPEPKPAKPSYLVSLLRQHFGLNSFRPGQEEVIDALLSGRDVFCSMPPHWGKSLCYKLSALLMPGITLVISRTLPDKPETHSGILSPSITPTKKRELLRRIKNGSCKILYATLPELQALDVKAALSGAEISMMAVIGMSNLKECREYIDSITKNHVTTGIFTEAAGHSQRQEIMKSLRSPFRMITGFTRPDVSLRIIRTEHKTQALRDILDQKEGLNGVIFCSSPEGVYKLREALHGIDDNDNVVIMPGLLHKEITRKDIKFIVHYELPENASEFAGEISIAGENSECVIIASREDIRNADKALTRIINDTKPKSALAAYLGEEENIAPVQEKPEEIKADFSDYDFGNANEAQKEAITTTSGPLMIIAGPGTGKTFTLVHRAVFLIQKKHIKPESIMMAAFTDKAARELTARITEELASRDIYTDVNAMYLGTFHAICQRILNEYADYTRFSRHFKILDEFQHAYIIMKNIKDFYAIPGLNNVLIQSGKWKQSIEIAEYVNALSEELIDPEELLRDTNPDIQAIGQAMKTHDDILAANNSISYSALLTEAYRLLRRNPGILADLQAKIKHIMIDEYQDTNFVQEQLIFLLAGESHNICVVGDDDQSLYRFRGATVRNIIEFPEKFAKNECRIVRLMLNYRSRPDIINFFSEWMNSTGKYFDWGNFRHAKKLEAYRQGINTPSVIRLAGLHDKDEWHEKILSFIKNLNVADYNQIVFLFRSVKNREAQELAQYLEKHEISVYSPRANMFFERSEIHFAIGCLISMFPSYLDALNSDGFKFQGEIPKHIKYYRYCLDYVKRFIERPAYSSLKKWLIQKRQYHGKLQSYTGYTYSDLLYQLFQFAPFSNSLNADISGTVKEIRPARNLARLVRILRDYEYNYNINNLHGKYIPGQFSMMMNIYMRFLIDEGLDEHESDIPSGHVGFMTIHQSKGMEFPIVFVDSLYSSPMPAKTMGGQLAHDIEREYSRKSEFEPEDKIKYFDFWRLFYVAFSRAKDLLILTCRENSNTPSEYLEPAYNMLGDAEESFTPSAIEISAPKDSAPKDIYSFTSHILLYETCPLQYKFYRELEFTPHISNSRFLGTLVHSVIEDIHRAVLNHEEDKINEEQITEWLNTDYDHLSRTGQVYLNEASRETALAQVMRYVRRNGPDWSAITRAEADMNISRENYILEGKIDLITVRDGQIEIIDFKSGPKPNINISTDRDRLDIYRRQLNVYAYLTSHTLGLEADRLKLYYTGEESGNPEIIYSYDKKEADDIMQGFDETVSRIIAGDFNHKAKDLETCKECGFRYFCGRD